MFTLLTWYRVEAIPNKINAIRVVREMTGLSLREVKEAVEGSTAQNPIMVPLLTEKEVGMRMLELKSFGMGAMIVQEVAIELPEKVYLYQDLLKPLREKFSPYFNNNDRDAVQKAINMLLSDLLSGVFSHLTEFQIGQRVAMGIDESHHLNCSGFDKEQRTHIGRCTFNYPDI